MTQDIVDCGVHLLGEDDQLLQSIHLGSCVIVLCLRNVISIDTAYKADPNRDAVHPIFFTVGTDLRYGSSVFERTVSAYDIVITDLGEASLPMPAVDLLGANVGILRGGRTVDNDCRGGLTLVLRGERIAKMRG